ncbi:MAG: pseudouridine synthase [Candidatus Gastranaerophilales bacterium]|nr:pseudouridine synthase [Candidatus Gastranaerophilales bacterium]
MRINKYIAQSGIASRRKADELIEAGRVKVNGEVVTMLGFEIRRKDKVTVDDKLVFCKNYEYFRFYKPAGYITTTSDEKGRKTIYNLLPDSMRAMKPVGRLDKDSSGLIILTNDGDLIYDLTHPSIKVSKVYRVTVDSKLTKAELETLAKGIEIEKGKIAYADVELLEATNKESLLEMTLYQGMNRQIRKMIEFLGHNVISLKRIRHATIELTGLKKGQFKPLKPKQVKELRTYIEKIVNIKEEDNA